MMDHHVEIVEDIPQALAVATAPFTVMLVDDDDVAVESVLRAFGKEQTPWHVVTAGDGQEALDIMRGAHPQKRIESPYLVLLDINMPRMDGLTFLETVRADPQLHSTVVFMLTTSAREIDRAQAYDGHTAGYMVKSALGPQFSKLTRLLHSYGSTVRLPELPH
jgi:CheY-like chemotaxis protein